MSGGEVNSVCLFCGASNAADPDFLQAATDFGRLLAAEGVRLVYGGGGIGLMGRAAKACHEAGGRVLGVMPDFLRTREVIYDDVETVVVQNMHQRKALFLEESDAFVIMPGGVGTLEEITEVLSWRRLDLHRKPMVFVNLKGFWNGYLQVLQQTVEQRFTPSWVPDTWSVVDRVEDILEAARRPMAEPV